MVLPGLSDRHTPIVAIGNILFQQSIRVPFFGTNGPLWSLAYEAFYYLLFPVALSVFLSRSFRGRLLSTLLLVAGCLCAGGPVLKLFPAWLLGAAVYVMGRRTKRMRTPGWSQACAMALLILAMVAAKAGGGGWTLMVVGVGGSTAALLFLVRKDVAGPRAVSGSVSLLSRLAGSSYSLYATHCPLLVLAAALLMPSASSRVPPGSRATLWVVLSTVAATLLAVAFAAATENQTNRVRGRILRRTVRVTTIPGPSGARLPANQGSPNPDSQAG